MPRAMVDAADGPLSVALTLGMLRTERIESTHYPLGVKLPAIAAEDAQPQPGPSGKIGVDWLLNTLSEQASQMPMVPSTGCRPCAPAPTSAGGPEKRRNQIHHTQISTETGKKIHLCPYEGCNYTASGTGHLYRHMRVHTGEKPFQVRDSLLDCRYDPNY